MRQKRATARRHPNALDQVDGSIPNDENDRAADAPDEAPDPESLRAHLLRYQDWLRVRHYAALTIKGRAKCLRLFLDWLEVRSLTLPHEVTRAVVERYQRHLFDRRKRNGQPLGAKTQHTHLSALRTFFKWLAQRRVIQVSPAAELVFPRMGRRLPRQVFTAAEVDAILAQPDVDDPIGLRDRAILEVLYSTGLRRTEVIGLGLHDIDNERGVLLVRSGKGNRDRVVAIGTRAIAWVDRYRYEARPALVLPPDDGTLFLSQLGNSIAPNHLSAVVRGYVEAAGILRPGACHLFRHTMATQMLDRGADIRFVQDQLGHAELSTTAIYTQVSIRALKAVHSRTHPAEATGHEEQEVADDDLG